MTGAVDDSFGASGAAVVRSGRHWSFSDVQSLGGAPDGGLYVVAPTRDFDGLTRPVKVVKLTTTGQVATDYGDGGFATTPPAWGDVFAFPAAFGVDGRIVMACRSDEEGTYPCVVAMGPDGFVDSEFGVAGRAVAQFDQLPPHIYWSRLVVDRDGGIYEAATASSLPFAHRWIAAGRVDRSFGADGVVTGFTRTESVIGAVALDHQGRLLVTAGGSAWGGSGEITRFLVD